MGLRSKLLSGLWTHGHVQCGALLSGVISDRLGRKNVLAWAYLIRAGTFALLLWHHEMALYVFAVVGGLVWLATPLRPWR